MEQAGALKSLRDDLEGIELQAAELDLSPIERQAAAVERNIREMAAAYKLPAESVEELVRRSRAAFEKIRADAEALTINLGQTLSQPFRQILEGFLQGNRELNVLEVFKDAAIGVVGEMFAGMIEQKLDFDAKFERNFLQDLGGVLQKFGAKTIDFFGSLFSAIADGISALVKGAGSALGSLGGAGGGGGIGSLVVGALSLVGFARGGIVKGPTASLLGEDPATRPEVVAPLSDLTGAITRAVAAGSGGGGVVVNVIDQAGVNTEVNDRGRGAQGQRELEILVTRTVTRDLVGGGSISSALDQTRGLQRVGR